MLNSSSNYFIMNYRVVLATLIMFYYMLYGPNTDLVGHPLEKFRVHSFLLQVETVVCVSCGSHRTKNKVSFLSIFGNIWLLIW